MFAFRRLVLKTFTWCMAAEDHQYILSWISIDAHLCNIWEAGSRYSSRSRICMLQRPSTCSTSPQVFFDTILLRAGGYITGILGKLKREHEFVTNT